MFANWSVATQRRVLVSLPVSELSDDSSRSVGGSDSSLGTMPVCLIVSRT
jgi:hypothetical protein